MDFAEPCISPGITQALLSPVLNRVEIRLSQCEAALPAVFLPGVGCTFSACCLMIMRMTGHTAGFFQTVIQYIIIAR